MPTHTSSGEPSSFLQEGDFSETQECGSLRELFRDWGCWKCFLLVLFLYKLLESFAELISMSSNAFGENSVSIPGLKAALTFT